MGRLSATITEDRVAAYARLTDDFNPIHMDEAFAAKTPFGTRIAHGTMNLALIWDLVGEVEGQEIDVKFVAPGPVGAAVEASANRQPDASLVLQVSCGDRTIIEATARHVEPLTS